MFHRHVANILNRLNTFPLSVAKGPGSCTNPQAQRKVLKEYWWLSLTEGTVFGSEEPSEYKMDIDSPQTPNFSGLKDFPLGLFKVSGPPRVSMCPMKDDLPHIPEKEEYSDSGVFFSSVDSTPEPREADANFFDIASDSTEGSESISIDDGKEGICSPDLDLEREKESACSMESFFSPLKSDKISLDDLSAGPPILDLTRLMMQPLRSTPKPTNQTVLPEGLLNTVSGVVKAKLQAGKKVSEWTEEDEKRTQLSLCVDRQVKLEKQNISCDENDLFNIDLVEECTEEVEKISKKRAKKRKSGSSADIKSKKEKKVVPNYFVAVQVRNPEIHSNISSVQEHVASVKPCLRAAFIPTQTLHLTLHVSHLGTEDDISRAKAALEECQDKVTALWTGGHAPLLHIVGLGTFKDNVVFTKVEKGPSLEILNSVAEIVQDCFLKHEIRSTDDRGFKPHITMMKLSKAPRLRYKGIKKIHPDMYSPFRECEFGWQRVLGLQLCSMLKPKDQNGYYHVAHEVTFDLPEGEPLDGGAGITANFQPRVVKTEPIRAVVKLEKELKWSFSTPRETAE